MVPKTFEDAVSPVKSLAEKSATNQTVYFLPRYQEAGVRQGFLDKFFVSAGWEVYRQEHPDLYEHKVRIEKNVMVKNRDKRAGYAFFTAQNRVEPYILAEAK